MLYPQLKAVSRMKPIVLVGEAKGVNEEAIDAGFVGASGIELLRMLNEAKIIELTSEDFAFIKKYYDKGDPTMIDCVWQMHPEVYRTNVFQFHPQGNDIASVCGSKAEGIIGYPALLKSKYVRAEFVYELERLADEIVMLDPNLVVALGNTALWALCGTTGISKMRGTTCYSSHTATGFKVLSTYHPAAVIRQWTLRPTTVVDLMKAQREAEFPEVRRTKREIYIDPTTKECWDWAAEHIKDFASVDIENPGGPITEVGFAPDHTKALVVPIRKAGKLYPDAKGKILFCKAILKNPKVKKVFQNGLYDVAVLWRQWGAETLGFEEDTMILHHNLQPESLKSLGFLGSVYCDEGNWKQMRTFSSKKRDD